MSSKVRVCAFESRRAPEMGRLIERFHGIPTVAPSMQEVPLESNSEPLHYIEKLLSGEVDVSVFMTGVGTQALYDAVESRISADELTEEIRKTVIAVRGPKPAAVLAKLGLQPNVRAPEPNTWHELAEEMSREKVVLSEKTVAVQEYGVANTEFHEWLSSQGAEVLSVSIYRWTLPDDIKPLQDSVRQLINNEFDLILWTSAQQINHVIQTAKEMNLFDEWFAVAKTIPHASIGPTASERLRQFDLSPCMEPSHPKMAHLVREAIEWVQKN
ncbi:bifunctional uroporphyrinogen-III synthetase/response regulator domain protein [Thalassoglobus neptunius]|uniref:Bifunctional uroporphyrinogen-III synthetase/response regulator domain protein n=1 Tax=Thalassoglobus neptunius TaxID=1938619 RepID=A0A5C5X3I9_9PLAN|nr:uroporphyrinogen-III synthase [Thalassoglobus neptunius]TWT57594.1 bifunctional uroporphyrinogen-III synthetase/response regulator domain protein [Thalassoglobus neptunius]